jgi:hypothetical protein
MYRPRQVFDLTTTEDHKTRIDYHEDELQSYKGAWADMVISKRHGVCVGASRKSYEEAMHMACWCIEENKTRGIHWVVSNISFPPHDIIEAFPIPAKD